MMFLGAIFVLVLINLFAFASHDDRLRDLERKAMDKIGGIYDKN